MAKAKQQRKYTIPLNPKVVAQMQFHQLCSQVRHWTDGEWTWEADEQKRFFTELLRLIESRLFPPYWPDGTPRSHEGRALAWPKAKAAKAGAR